MGKVFERAIRRFKGKFVIDQKIIQIIECLNKDNMQERISIDEALKRLINYCDQKNYSDSIDIIPFLKKKKIFIQTPFNVDNESFSLLSKIYQKQSESFPEKNPFKNSSYGNILGFVCLFVDESKGFYQPNKRVYLINDKEYKINQFGYPYFIENNRYTYLADIETNSFIKFEFKWRKIYK